MKLQALLTAVMLFAPIFASSNTISSGVNPDSVLWGLDVALDKISLALTRSPEKKAEKALEIAQERLMEVKAMAEEGKFEAVAKAENEHESTINEVENSLNEIDDNDPEAQMEKELKLETKLKEHRINVEKVKTELKVKIQVEGELTVEQQARLDEFLASLTENTNKANIQIQNKKDNTKIKIREKTGESEGEVNQRVEKLELERGLLDEEIEVMGKVFGNKTYVEIDFGYDSDLTEKSAVIAEFIEKFYLDTNRADTLLKMQTNDDKMNDSFKVKLDIGDEDSEVEAKLRFVVDATQRDQVVDAITKRTSLELPDVEAALVLKEKQADEEDKVEIEVEIKSDTSKVKIKLGGQKTRLELDTVNRTEILATIAAQLGLSVEDIDKLVKFGNEADDENKGEIENEDKSNSIEENEDTNEISEDDKDKNTTSEKDIEDKNDTLSDIKNETEISEPVNTENETNVSEPNNTGNETEISEPVNTENETLNTTS